MTIDCEKMKRIGLITIMLLALSLIGAIIASAFAGEKLNKTCICPPYRNCEVCKECPFDCASCNAESLGCSCQEQGSTINESKCINNFNEIYFSVSWEPNIHRALTKSTSDDTAQFLSLPGKQDKNFKWVLEDNKIKYITHDNKYNPIYLCWHSQSYQCSILPANLSDYNYEFVVSYKKSRIFVQDSDNHESVLTINKDDGSVHVITNENLDNKSWIWMLTKLPENWF